MLGYIKDNTRVLNEWYQLFKKIHPCISVEDYKHWKNIVNFDLLNEEKDELWNSTFFEEFFKFHFVINDNLNLDTKQYDMLSLDIDCHKLVFINGKFSSKFSDFNIDPWILKLDYDVTRYKKFSSIYPTIFLYLTECLSNFTIHIQLPENIKTKKPLYILHISSGSDISNYLINSHYHHYIETGTDTETCIIEHFVNTDKNNYFTGSRMLMSIGNRSKLEHTKLIFENQYTYHISHQDIKINTCSQVNSNTFIISGPKFTYNRINSKINYSQSYLSLNSLAILSKKDMGNISTYVEHNNTDYALSKQLHKIIAKDNSISLFKGLIKVNQKSLNTDGSMVNNNLLLNKHASVYSIPQLEIYSDSVKCGHGSTVGHIDNNNLFYLRTRGINKEDALNILIYAFTTEITEKIRNSILKKVITSKIKQSLTGQ